MSKNQHIILIPYDASWPRLFEREAARITAALGSNLVAIHHIGSTAIPNLAAKPIIDILPIVKDITIVNKNNDSMGALEYTAKGEYGLVGRRYFSNNKFHVHIYQTGDPSIEQYLQFRNFLRDNNWARIAYEKLKRELAQRHPENRNAYSLAKTDFVKSIVKLGTSNGNY